MEEVCGSHQLVPVKIPGLEAVRPLGLSERQQRASWMAADVCYGCGLLVFHLNYEDRSFEAAFKPRLSPDELAQLKDME